MSSAKSKMIEVELCGGGQADDEEEENLGIQQKTRHSLSPASSSPPEKKLNIDAHTPSPPSSVSPPSASETDSICLPQTLSETQTVNQKEEKDLEFYRKTGARPKTSQFASKLSLVQAPIAPIGDQEDWDKEADERWSNQIRSIKTSIVETDSEQNQVQPKSRVSFRLNGFGENSDDNGWGRPLGSWLWPCYSDDSTKFKLGKKGDLEEDENLQKALLLSLADSTHPGSEQTGDSGAKFASGSFCDTEDSSVINKAVSLSLSDVTSQSASTGHAGTTWNSVQDLKIQCQYCGQECIHSFLDVHEDNCEKKPSSSRAVPAWNSTSFVQWKGRATGIQQNSQMKSDEFEEKYKDTLKAWRSDPNPTPVSSWAGQSLVTGASAPTNTPDTDQTATEGAVGGAEWDVRCDFCGKPVAATELSAHEDECLKRLTEDTNY